MRVAFLAPELARWDASSLDGLVGWVFADERPPRGVAGLLDWRTCGRVSRWMQSGAIAGRPGEAMLFPPGHGLPFRMALLLGAGERAAHDEASFRQAVRDGLDRAQRLGLRRFAMGLLARSPAVSTRRAIEILLDEGNALDVDLFLVEPPAAQKEMGEVVRQRRITAP